MKERNWRAWLAWAFLALGLLAGVAFLGRLSTPLPELMEVSLFYEEGDSKGWQFATEAGPIQPELGMGGYLQGFPADAPGPVSARRVMEDVGSRTLLKFSYAGQGIQVFLDETLLYTDFPHQDNRAGTFLSGVTPEEIPYRQVMVSLPEGYQGKVLEVVTYSPLIDGYRQMAAPILSNEFATASMLCPDVVWPVAAVTASLLLALALFLTFGLGAREGRARWSLLPLACYFLLAVLPLVARSYLATTSGLDSGGAWTDWVQLGAIDLLFAFLALEMKGWRRWLLLAGAGLHALISAAWAFLGVPAISGGLENDPVGFALFLLAVGLMLSVWRAGSFAG